MSVLPLPAFLLLKYSLKAAVSPPAKVPRDSGRGRRRGRAVVGLAAGARGDRDRRGEIEPVALLTKV